MKKIKRMKTMSISGDMFISTDFDRWMDRRRFKMNAYGFKVATLTGAPAKAASRMRFANCAPSAS